MALSTNPLTGIDLTDEHLLITFLASPRPVPSRPKYFMRSTVVVRAGPLPSYYAIYCHLENRFIELHYDRGDGSGNHVVRIPADRQPPLIVKPARQKRSEDLRGPEAVSPDTSA
jgi:hypothetical protein